MSDLYEYHDYIAYGVIKDDKITGFCKIVWNIEFSSVYLPLSHILIGIADEQYRRNSDLESDVPTVKYGVDLLYRSGKIVKCHIMKDSEEHLLISRDNDERVTFVGEHISAVRNGFGVEIVYTDTKDTLLYGFWESGVLRYRLQNDKWIEA